MTSRRAVSWLSAGGFDFRTDPNDVSFVVVIKDDWNWIGEPYDGYTLASYNNLPTPTGGYISEISWELQDYSRDALSSDTLPTTAPVLEDWEEYQGLWIVGDFFIGAHVTETVLIPEPATVLLLGLGGLALEKVHRRKSRYSTCGSGGDSVNISWC